MSTRATPLVAYGIDEVPLGSVKAVRSCCFEIDLPDGAAWLTPEAVYSVATGRVTLVCMAASARSYSCLVHTPSEAVTGR
jgi:hypothetical protein